MKGLEASESSREASERRFLTIEFIDLVGSTGLAERLDPEDLGAVLRRYQRLAVDVMERFGGFVAQVFGDGILVYFGYPAAHENDAERAVRAAQALLKELREVDGPGLPRLEARAGIHSGLVLVAEELLGAGGPGRAAVGEVINLAARLQAEASPGGIAISQETMELVDGVFACRSLGPKPIKGLSRKVEVYEVLRALPETKRAASRLRRGATRLVGREAVIDRLVSIWKVTAAESRCQVVAIVGEAGVGKTRLMLEISSRPEIVEATLFQVQCHEIFASTPLYPIGAFFWARIGLTADDDEPVRQAKISAYLSEVGRDDEDHRRLVAGLLGLTTVGAETPPGSAPQLLKRAQYEFVVSMVQRAAAMRPVILWIEDAHWLDPSSAELLHDIVAQSTQSPVLIVVTMRRFPEGPPLPTLADQVALEPLGPRDCLELAQSVPGASLLSDEMMSRVVDAAEGVPFFVEQLVISLIEEQSRGPAPHRRLGGVPLMLAELMSERLDRRPGARRIAQTAACIGRAFTPDFLVTLLDADAATLQRQLEGLVEAEILRPRRYGAEIRYEFRHALLQRMAHESMVHAERRQTHQRLVGVLQERGEPVIPEVLAYHLTEAGSYPQAIGAWLKAGISATKRSAHIEAIEHIRQGLGLLDRIPDLAARNGFEINLQRSLMGSLLATQSATSSELAACCARGLELCEATAAAAMVFPFAFGQFTFVNCRGRGDEAISLATMFVTRAETDGFRSERVIGHRMMGQALLARGDAAAARAELERSLALYDAERDAATTLMYGQNTEVHTKSLLSLTHLCLGDVDAALAIGLDALRTADAVRHPHSSAIPMVYVGGWVFGLCEATEQMMAAARSLLALAEQHRLYGFRAHAAAFLGWALCQGGNPGQGIPMIAKAIAAFDAVQFRLAEAGHLANLAEAQRRVGRLSEAAASCERALQLMQEGSSWLEPELRRVQAVVAADLGPADGAETESLFHAAIESARKLQFPLFERRCLVSFHEFLKSSDRHDAEIEERLGALAHLSDLGPRVGVATRAHAPV